MKENTQLIFRKYYHVPFAYKYKVKETILDHEIKRILVRIEKSEWASPIVLVKKSEGKSEFVSIRPKLSIIL